MSHLDEGTLHALLDGELEMSEMAEIQAHLGSCAACGSRLREVGSRARRQIEALLGTKVYLDLHVTVAKDWQRDPKQLRKLGFDG